MSTTVKFVIGLAVGVLIWKVGLPFIQSYGYTVPGAPGELNVEGWGCVRQVQDTRDQLAEILSRARPNEPVNFLDKLREEQSEAEILCQCEQRGCAEGKEALYVIGPITAELGEPARVGEVVLTATRDLEKIDAILERATAAARAASR